jgi:hypothetical protein
MSDKPKYNDPDKIPEPDDLRDAPSLTRSYIMDDPPDKIPYTPNPREAPTEE